MDPKKPPGTGDHPSTRTARTERPVFEGDSEKVDRPLVFEDDDTFLEGRPPARRPETAALSVLEADDVQHSGESAVAGEFEEAFGEGAVVEEQPSHTTEVLEAPKRGSREPSGSGRAIPVDVDRWQEGQRLPPTTRATQSAESLPTVEADAAMRLIDDAIELVRVTLAEVERMDGGAGASGDVHAALESLLEAQRKLLG